MFAKLLMLQELKHIIHKFLVMMVTALLTNKPLMHIAQTMDNLELYTQLKTVPVVKLVANKNFMRSTENSKKILAQYFTQMVIII